MVVANDGTKACFILLLKDGAIKVNFYPIRGGRFPFGVDSGRWSRWYRRKDSNPMEYSIIYQLITTPISVDKLMVWCSAQNLVINYIIYFREMLTNAFSVLVKNPVKESFYVKKKKQLIFWQFFSFPKKIMSKIS